MEYKFNYNEKEYILNEEKLEAFFNDEEKPLEGIDEKLIIELMNGSTEVDFQREYFGSCCGECKYEKGETKAFKFLEYFFYVYSKENNYVISSISSEYENTNYTTLFNKGEIDNSYIVRIFVCENCGVYTIEIEEIEI